MPNKSPCMYCKERTESAILNVRNIQSLKQSADMKMKNVRKQ